MSTWGPFVLSTVHRMLITFVPLTQCVSSCQLGATRRTKPFSAFECQHPPPPLFPPSVVCVHLLTPSHLFHLLFSLMCNNGKPAIHTDVIVFFLALRGLFQVCVYSVVCFVLLCGERDHVCSTGRWTEVILWAYTHTHTLSVSTKVSTLPSVSFCQVKIRSWQVSAKLHNTTWNVDPCVSHLSLALNVPVCINSSCYGLFSRFILFLSHLYQTVTKEHNQ